MENTKIQGILTELQNMGTKRNKTINTNIKIDNSLDANNPLVVKGLSAIILRGVEQNASDIHIEPLRDKTRIRYRVDGVLIEGEQFTSSLHNSLISRLKIISQLDITEKKIPQNGKFKLEIKERLIDFRVSIVPLITGEKAVIRILDKDILNFSLENIGFNEEDYQKIVKLINKKSGILLATGPTGSGKSSLIYSILKKINNGDINISTVEDPVEYEINGINQVQYNAEVGRDFATILKSYLRQDPDVLMIGEIRDFETAEIAIKSAMTGHLVLSTLHTNDAISSIFRLLNIGLENYMLSASIIGIVAQRLVRKLCPHCKEQDAHSATKLKTLKIEKICTEKIFYTAKGCEKCYHTGYLGRVAIFQLVEIDEQIKKMIDSKCSQREIDDYTKSIGIKNLIESGVEKALLGITSLDEILKEC